MRGAVVAVLLWAGGVSAQDAAPRTGWVVLPVEQYHTLRQQAHPTEAPPPDPPVLATLTRIDYDLRVAGETASGTALLTVDVLGDGWINVRIPPGLRLGGAKLDGRPVSIVAAASDKPDDGPRVLVSRRGRAVLALEIAVPVVSSAGTESLTLPPAGSAVTRAAVVVPREGVDVTVAGALLGEKADAKAESRWVAYGDGRSALSFSWRRKVEDRRATMPLRFRGTLVQHVGYGEESAQLVADVRLDVVQGLAPNVSLHVEGGLAVNQVSGRNVADWEMKDGVLTVTFLEPVESTEGLVVTGETRTAREGRLVVPLLRLPAAERETGGVAVEVLGAGEVTASETRGMDAADATELAEGTAGRSWGLVSAFRFRPLDGRAPRALAVSLSRYTPQAVLLAAVDEARYHALLTEDGKTLVQARYAVRNNAQSFLVVTLPESAILWSAAVSGRPVRPGRSKEDALLLPLEKGKAGEEAPAFLVELVYLARGAAWTRQGRTSLHLPSLDLPVSRTGIVLYAPPRHRVFLEPGAFRLQDHRPPFAAALSAAPVVSAHATADAGDKAPPDSVQSFVDRLQKVGGGARRLAGSLPIFVPFPEYGSSVFLASELTKDGEAPVIDFRYKQSRKGGRG